MIRVLGPRILVRREEDPGLKSAVLEVVSYDATPSQFGTVVAVGNGARDNSGARQPMPFKTGDKVLLSKYSGGEVEVDGETLAFVMEEDVLAILEL